ncbi:hypothetical protein IAR55_004450 [Kwoniella newhampshirensis]|uniref:PH domain-containing protein n=1 Tax=Kwoniella newhampshirensis TaxID=1651941 RepID=A0AAW0YJR9_9TREE
MRHVLALKEKPNYSLHFQIDEPFTSCPPPSYSFVGAARAPLRLLGGEMSSAVTVPILCPYTMEAIGSCRVDSRCTPASTSGIASPASWQPLRSALNPRTRFSFTITVDSVKGMTSDDYAIVHTQVRLSTLLGPNIATENTFASKPVDLDETSVSHLNLRRSVATVVTPEIISYLREGYAIIEFFAKAKPEYLDRLERWDRNREASPPRSSPGTPLRSSEVKPSMRRCETDFIGPELHDILANVEIKELASNGGYVSAEVYDDIFQLHQGLQRRLSITLTHSSGAALAWKRIYHASSSDVRVVEKGHTTSASKPDHEMKLGNQEVDDLSDGTSILRASGVWDTAVHACRQLDRRTPADQHLLVKLTWLLEVDTLDEPAIFHMDLPIKILSRDAKRSSILTFWSPRKVYRSATSIFSLILTPPLARSAQDLWRLDTAKKHVRGEEALGGWKPRSLSLLKDLTRLKRSAKGLADVQATKAVLDLVGEVPLGNEMGPEDREALLRRCLDLWKLEMDQRFSFDFKKESAEEEAVAKNFRKLLPELEPKLVPTVKSEVKVDNVVKSGPLKLLRDSQANEWEKLDFVLRRPYLYIHENPNEREIQIINLTKAHTNVSPDVERLLHKRWAFTIFTPTNSYILQAGSEKELREWFSVISASCED